MISLKLLKKQAEKAVKRAENLKELQTIFQKYLGKKGEVTRILRSLKRLPKSKKVKIGKEANHLKIFLKTEIEKRSQIIKEMAQKIIQEKEWIDVTLPGKKPQRGHLHPLTLVKKRTEDIFQVMGFSVIEGPEIENEWYNFDSLNIPKDHPARDAWNTFWIKNSKLLLRTHTSPVQVRYMEKNNPPLKIIIPGRIFRHEATDASHEINFYQVEGLMIDKRISAANFKAIIQEFFKRFFGKPVKIRMRPSYFPFTEPSFEVDMSCLNCAGRGCSACSQTGWLEVMGAGMVHPLVYKAAGLIPKDWQGFAFGIGLDRLAMMKYKINDIRLLYGGDLRFLKQF